MTSYVRESFRSQVLLAIVCLDVAQVHRSQEACNSIGEKFRLKLKDNHPSSDIGVYGTLSSDPGYGWHDRRRT